MALSPPVRKVLNQNDIVQWESSDAYQVNFELNFIGDITYIV